MCLNEGQLLAIELEDPANGSRFWSLPGGQVEPDETIEDCAIRETLEETGYAVELTRKLFSNQYMFNWNNLDYLCTTHWFEGRLLSETPIEVNDADYLLRAEWLPWPDARELFNYHPSLSEAVARFN